MDFAPSVYEHAAGLIGKTPWEVSRDGDLLFQAHAEAFRLYRHRPVVVGIDIYNLEAEAYGARIEKPAGTGIPAITGHICSAAGEVMELTPLDSATAGRIPMVLRTARRLAAEFPEADVRIPVSGPFSIASNLLGFESLLCDTIDAPKVVGEALLHLVEGQIAFCREVTRSGLDIAFFESAAAPPLVSPRLFAELELPALKAIIGRAADVVGHPVPCIIGGDTAPILDSVLETGTGYVICPSETDQPAFMERMKSRPDVMVRINMKPAVTATADMPALHAEADRVMALAEGCKKACIGTGALPYEAKPELVLEARRYVQLGGRL